MAVCGLPGASSAIESVALRVPAAGGWNVTLMPQLAPAATVLGVEQVVPPAAVVKSLLFVPEMEMLVILSVEVPLLISAIVSLTEVLTGTLPKSN